MKRVTVEIDVQNGFVGNHGVEVEVEVEDNARESEIEDEAIREAINQGLLAITIQGPKDE